MTDKRIDLLAGARASLRVARTLDGRPKVCGNTTAAEREALRAEIDAGLAALRSRFAFDPENVVRLFDVLAIVTVDDGTQVIVDPLNLLVPLLATVDDDPLARRH
jgi:hypothetical protein